MKNKSILLAFGILTILVIALVIAHSNQSQEITGNKKGTNEMMAGMMESSNDGMMGRGMMPMMMDMMDMEEMNQMHQEMIAEMKEHVDELKDNEKKEMQEMIEHMESCPMMN